MARLAVLGAVFAVAAAIAAIGGAADAAMLLATPALIALVWAFVGVVVGTLPRAPRERRPAFTGETAWLRAMLREHPKPLRDDAAQRRPPSDTRPGRSRR